jgi:hypothetical protein
MTRDQRKQPGDGKRAPHNHIVRIVVVPGVEATSKRDSHRLSDEQLDMATKALKRMDAPPASNQTAKQQTANMFEALDPTDIVVVGQEPASVCEGKLLRHDDRNYVTVLRVWTESDTIEYQCAVEFAIAKVKKAGWRIYNAPDDPFGNSKDGYKASEIEKGLWVWRSGLLPASANNQQYKMTFRIGGRNVDPDVVCGNPPPTG